MQFTTIMWQSELRQQEIRLRDEVLRSPLGLVFTAEQLATEDSEFHFGVVEQEQLIACVVVTPLSENRAKLRQMAVAPSQQRKGIGAFLVQNVEAALAKQGVTEIELNARLVAMGFYEKLGYQAQGEQFIEVNIPHFKMTKHLG